MKQNWEVMYDGCSLAMIKSPSGRIFGIQELGAQCNQWGNALDNDEICATLVDLFNVKPGDLFI